jgi:RNA polymerase sigma factor (sigma-70 family)
MDQALKKPWPMADQNERISETVDRERPRLRNFIRSRVADPSDAEDILQEVFYELVETYRLMNPVEHVTAWLFQVARNRITDLFRRKAREARHSEPSSTAEDEEASLPFDLLPSPDSGPEAAYARRVLLEELDEAFDELPEEQLDVFIAHELLGYSFKEIADQTGVGINTLLSRKHYAVLFLRGRLEAIHDDFNQGKEQHS